MNKAIEIQAPNPFESKEGYKTIFLAGSIENGLAAYWQRGIVSKFSDKEIIFLNPRRNNWNPSLENKITNTEFKEQVEWELDGLDACDLIIMVFDEKTSSPISLLELGLHARSNKMVVLCPNGFWRKDNVDIVCERYGVQQVKSMEELINFIENL